MPISFKVDNVEISALRDRVMFNTFAGNKSYVCKGFGNELAVTSSSASFVVSLGSGEAVICGGSMICEGEGPTLTLPANQSGYLVIRVDLSQTEANICQFKNVSSIVQGNINNGTDLICDLPLYQYTTNNDGVSSLVNRREIYESSLDNVNSSISSLESSVSGKAPTNHASTASTYGLGNPTNYGHVKTIDALTQSKHINGTALSAYQGKVLNDKVNSKSPINHASANTTYGLGTKTNYGHVKTIDALTQASYQDGTALSAYQGKVLFDKIKQTTNGTIVDNSYNIETLGNYTQYQTWNDTNNSLTIASGTKLYFLVSFNNSAQAYQLAIMADNSVWYRFYRWWAPTGWQSWKCLSGKDYSLAARQISDYLIPGITEFNIIANKRTAQFRLYGCLQNINAEDDYILCKVVTGTNTNNALLPLMDVRGTLTLFPAETPLGDMSRTKYAEFAFRGDNGNFVVILDPSCNGYFIDTTFTYLTKTDPYL